MSECRNDCSRSKWLRIFLNFSSSKRFQLNRSKKNASSKKMFKMILINMWFESWFKFDRVLHVRIRSLRFSIVKHMSMIDSEFWKWKYVSVFLNRLNWRRNSFIKKSIFENLLSTRVATSSHDEWWMLKSFTMTWFLI